MRLKMPNITCPFKVGDTIQVKKGYIEKMKLGPILTYNDGDKYIVTGIVNNPFETKKTFNVKCLSSVRQSRVGKNDQINYHMPVYDFFEKV